MVDLVNRRAGAGWARTAFMGVLSLMLAACSGGGVSSTDTSANVAAYEHTVGGTVTGLTGSGLVLQDNSGDNLAVAANGSFRFPTSLVTGDSYTVSVFAEPSAPDQTCTVSGGAGSISSSDITGVAVACVVKTTTTDTIGGTASGVVGSGLVLQDNDGDSLAVPSSGPFTFAAPLASGVPYTVSVLSPPISPYQDCIVTNASGTTAGSDISNVTVTCKTNASPAYTIGGTVSGITGAGSVVLQDNGRDNLTLAADGAFQFALPIPSGSTYNVTSLSIQGQQSQTCAFTNATGTVGNANVTNVAVVCKANAVVSVTVSGLAGTGLVLQDNGGDSLTVTKNGAITFATALTSGSAYDVTVSAQPSNPTQNCVVTNGKGVAVPGTPAAVTVVCTTTGFSVGGTITNLTGTGLVLQDNGGNNLNVPAGATSYAFPAPTPSGGAYNIGVLTQPSAPTQTCTVNNGVGTVTNAAVSVAVVCQTNSYTVGGSLSGVPAGIPAGVVLQDNGGANLTVNANGPFTFPTALLSGSTYTVTLAAAPQGYYCALAGATGTVANANITNVAVTCTLIGAYLYVTNSGDNSISTLVIDANSGALVPMPGTTATGSDPRSSVTGCFAGNAGGTLYVANLGDNTVSAYTANESTGALAPLNPATATGAAPDFLDFVFTQNGVCVLLALNSADNSASTYTADGTGALTVADGPFATGATPSGSANATFSNTEDANLITVEYVANRGSNSVSAYTIDPNTGDLTLISSPAVPIVNPIAAGTAPVSVVIQTITVNGVLFPFVYVANHGSNTISGYSADSIFGNLTQVTDPLTGTPIAAATGNGPTALLALSEGAVSYVYAANGTDGTLTAYTISTGGNSQIGTLTPFNVNAANGGPTIATGTNPVAITQAYVNGIQYLFVTNGSSNNVSVFSVNTANGELTAVPGSPFATGAAPTSAAVQFPPQG